MNLDFEALPHTADIKIRVYGSSLAELFRNALIGMFQSIKPHIEGCTYVNDRLVCPDLPYSHEIILEAPDRELLLIDFLSQALYLSDVHDEAYLDAYIGVATETSIHATIFGATVTGFEVVEIKAVTYHDLYVKQINDHWQAEIVFDI